MGERLNKLVKEHQLGKINSNLDEAQAELDVLKQCGSEVIRELGFLRDDEIEEPKHVGLLTRLEELCDREKELIKAISSLRAERFQLNYQILPRGLPEKKSKKRGRPKKRRKQNDQ